MGAHLASGERRSEYPRLLLNAQRGGHAVIRYLTHCIGLLHAHVGHRCNNSVADDYKCVLPWQTVPLRQPLGDLVGDDGQVDVDVKGRPLLGVIAEV